MKTHYELKRMHTQHKNPIIKGRTTRPLVNYLSKRNIKPFDYDVEKWIWDGKEWDVEYFTGEDIVNNF
jgi:hypothetical protein